MSVCDDCDKFCKEHNEVKDGVTRTADALEHIQKNALPHIEAKLAVLAERAGWLKWLLIIVLGLRGLIQAKEWLSW